MEMTRFGKLKCCGIASPLPSLPVQAIRMGTVCPLTQSHQLHPELLLTSITQTFLFCSKGNSRMTKGMCEGDGSVLHDRSLGLSPYTDRSLGLSGALSYTALDCSLIMGP